MDRFRREPTKFHYKKRWPSNGWTKKRNQITCNKEERISPPSYNKRPDAFWTIPLKTKGLCKFDKLETKSKRIFRKSDYIGLIYLARCLRFFFVPLPNASRLDLVFAMESYLGMDIFQREIDYRFPAMDIRGFFYHPVIVV